MRLQGVDMRVLLSDYQLDSTHLVYSTSELMTHQADLDGSDLALFHTRDGQDGETVLRYTTEPAVQTVSGPAPAVTWDAARGDLRLDYTGEGLSEVRITPQGGGRPLTLLLAAESVARTFWRLDTAQGPVIARGPQLLRTASIDQGTAVLTGDTTDATDLQVWAPAGVHKVTWNGDTVADGHLAGTQAPALPALTTWRVQAETPEAQPGFDDSDWVVADHTTSASTTKLPAGQTTVLYADDYGFHHGDVWYRGRYTGADAATGVTLKYQTGQVGQLSAWLDGRYLGSDQVPTPTSKESTTQTWARTASFAVPADLRDGQEHVLSVLARPMASEEDGGANDAFKSARGLTAATLTGDAGALTTPVTWKLQGAQGGEHLTDTVRGPLNNGGLYGERAGWSLPGYPDASWTTTTLPAAPSAPGVTWYRTDVDLKVKPFLDASLGLTLTDDPGKHYRALVFVNGWNLGQYANDVGPQHTFVLPNGVLDPRGHNTVALAVTSTDGSGPGNVSLTDLGTVRGGTPLELVDSPAYAAPTVSATAPAVTGRTVDGPLASVTVPADALGTRFAATVDWGDGTSSDALVSGTGATRTVSGDHGYAKAGRYAVTVQLRDAYGSPLGSDRTTVRAG
jgi:beta-galactosidase GanA